MAPADVALVRIILYGFPMPCREIPGHVHVREPGTGPRLCLSLEQLAALVPIAEGAIIAQVAA